jgi:hypothetical protein
MKNIFVDLGTDNDNDRTVTIHIVDRFGVVYAINAEVLHHSFEGIDKVRIAVGKTEDLHAVIPALAVTPSGSQAYFSFDSEGPPSPHVEP